MYPERPMPWMEVDKVFTTIGIHGYRPTDEEFKSFVGAGKDAHRMESSFMVEQKVDAQAFVNNPLTLRIKFYYKDDRKEFLEWKLVFGEQGGFVHHAAMTGYGAIRQQMVP